MKKRTLHECLTDKEMNETIGLISNQLYNEMDVFNDKTGLDMSALTATAFEKNKTSILKGLIGLNQTFTKDEINFVLRHMSEQIACMSLLLMKASELDY